MIHIHTLKVEKYSGPIEKQFISLLEISYCIILDYIMHTHKIFPKINALCMPYLDETERLVMIELPREDLRENSEG
jgi:hypothetical protein